MTAYSYLQMYFAFRIHTFSRRWEYTLVCWLLSLLRFAVAMVALAEDLKIPDQVVFDAQWKWSITTVLVVGAVNDLLIAGGLTYFMRGGRYQESVFPNWTIVKFSVRKYTWCDTNSVMT